MIVIVIVSGGAARMAHHLRVIGDADFPHLIEHEEVAQETPETGRFQFSHKLRAVSAMDLHEAGVLSIAGGRGGIESDDWELSPFPPDFPLDRDYLHDTMQADMRVVLTEALLPERGRSSGWPAPGAWEKHREHPTRPGRMSSPAKGKPQPRQRARRR